MATSKSQRIGIWVIAIAMIAGTVAGSVAMMIAPGNEAADASKQQEEYQKMLAEYQKQQEEERKKNEGFAGVEAAAFDKEAVKELAVAYLVTGEGEKVKATDKIKANYFGWDATGAIFDSTKKKGKDLAPTDFGLDQVIEGWTKGLTDVPVGSTVELTIPGKQAYGDEDTGSGRPVGPLKFVVEIKEIVK